MLFFNRTLSEVINIFVPDGSECDKRFGLLKDSNLDYYFYAQHEPTTTHTHPLDFDKNVKPVKYTYKIHIPTALAVKLKFHQHLMNFSDARLLMVADEMDIPPLTIY